MPGKLSIYDHHRSLDLITATADVNGLAQGFLGPVPSGYCWHVERLTSFVNATRTSAVCEIFAVGQESLSGYTATSGSRAGRQDVMPSNAYNAVADEKSPVYVGEGMFLVAFWSGLTQNDVAQLSAQIRVEQLIPQLGSPVDIAALGRGAEAGRLELEDARRGLPVPPAVPVATGDGKAV